MKNLCSSYATNHIIILFLSIVLTACSPGVYKKPAEDFLSATKDLKEIYFLERDLTLDSFQEDSIREARDDVRMLNAGKALSFKEFDEKYKDAISIDKKIQSVFEEKIDPIRQRAFLALENYASILVALASDEPTENIKSEITVFLNSTKTFLEEYEDLSKLGSSAQKASEFIGGINGYLAVINQVIDIISSIVRKNAIVKTISDSNESITKILSILRSESHISFTTRLTNYSNIEKDLKTEVTATTFTNLKIDEKIRKYEEYTRIVSLYENTPKCKIDSSFDAAIRAQSMLLEKAAGGTVNNWPERILNFKTQVEKLKVEIKKAR